MIITPTEISASLEYTESPGSILEHREGSEINTVDNFFELTTDINELLSPFPRQIPHIRPITPMSEETLYAEDNIDLNDNNNINPEIITEQITTRNNALFNLHDCQISIIGCGAIGSFTAPILARCGVLRFNLYDGDQVAVENIGVQNFYIEDIGNDKVITIYNQLVKINPCILSQVKSEYVQNTNNLFCLDQAYKQIVIISVDSMTTRRELVNYIHNNPTYNNVTLIDPRMGSETLQIYTFNLGWTVDDYLKTWYEDAGADRENCNARSTAYCADLAASFIANQVRKIASNQRFAKEILFNFPAHLFDSDQL